MAPSCGATAHLGRVCGTDPEDSDPILHGRFGVLATGAAVGITVGAAVSAGRGAGYGGDGVHTGAVTGPTKREGGG